VASRSRKTRAALAAIATPAYLASTAALFSACAQEPEPWVDVREACLDHNPRRNLYFGDLHVHTTLSFDAWNADVRADPRDAYRFAQGEAITIPGPASDQSVALDRPLDFAAVTDHAEFLAEVSACTDPSSPAYDAAPCVEFRTSSQEALVRFGLGLQSTTPGRSPEICDESLGGDDCPARAQDVWSNVIDAAEQAYDRTESCSFTSFVAYEWSGAPMLSNLHRNVIFRSQRVPKLPTSYYDEPTEIGLWRALERECNDQDSGINGCQALAIPHNSNWSNGNLLLPIPANTPAGDEVEIARLRARLEPLVEIYQHKGDSECSAGVSGILGAPDELCDFEKLRREPFEDCGDGTGTRGMLNLGCVSRRDFVRGALLAGLSFAREHGVNPLMFGLMASTDTHNATAGFVNEADYRGHFGRREWDATERLTGTVPAGPRNSPGGLVAVWAEENSREAIFDAMARREAYATSGPRIAVRVYGGWDLPSDLCSRPDLVDVGDEQGVPMGGILPAPPEGSGAPRFVVHAAQDPGTTASPGRALQAIQIIKGWVDDEGQHVEVIDVASEALGAVDETTCAVPEPGTPGAAGSATLCATWDDPSYDPNAGAFYYVRVLEQPTCRWSWRDCLALPEADRPAVCSDPNTARTIQERAWTSPIWVGVEAG
jgi:hypothetical protein